MSETAVLARIEYYPYGEVYSMSGGGSVYTFLGKEDPGVGMLDFGPRYYNATLGRFLSPDPILAGASAYSYAEGNPIMMYDPSGMRAQWTRKRWTAEELEQQYRDRCAGIAKARDMAEREQELAIWRQDNLYGFHSRSGIGNENLPGGMGGKTPDAIVDGGRSGQSYTEYELVHFTSNAGQDYYYFRKTGRVLRGVDLDWLGNPEDGGDSYVERILTAVKGIGVGAEVAGGTAGITKGGSSRYYFGGWKGNGSIRPFSVGVWGSRIAAGTIIASATLSVVEVTDEYRKEGQFGQKTAEKAGESLGGLTGAWAGALVGAEYLMYVYPPFGSIVGGIGGAIVGSIVGSDIGKNGWFH